MEDFYIHRNHMHDKNETKKRFKHFNMRAMKLLAKSIGLYQFPNIMDNDRNRG